MEKLTLDQAKDMAARKQGYKNWDSFMDWVKLTDVCKLNPGKLVAMCDIYTDIYHKANSNPPLISDYDGTVMESAKTNREVRDFINSIDDKFLDEIFQVRQENDIHYVHYMELNDEELFYHPEEREEGCMNKADWDEYYPELDKTELKPGIPVGFPMIGEQF